jgi:hypothetical protein
LHCSRSTRRSNVKLSKVPEPVVSIDGIAEANDRVDIRVIDRGPTLGQTLYVDVNGMTVLRLGQLHQEVEITREGTFDRQLSDPEKPFG